MHVILSTNVRITEQSHVVLEIIFLINGGVFGDGANQKVAANVLQELTTLGITAYQANRTGFLDDLAVVGMSLSVADNRINEILAVLSRQISVYAKNWVSGRPFLTPNYLSQVHGLCEEHKQAFLMSLREHDLPQMKKAIQQFEINKQADFFVDKSKNKTAPDGGTYHERYTEVMAASELEFEELADGRVSADMTKTRSYQVYYAPGQRNHSICEDEFESFFKAVGLTLAPISDFHGKLIFTPESSLLLKAEAHILAHTKKYSPMSYQPEEETSAQRMAMC